MASSSTQPITTADKSILTPLMTLEGHEPYAWNNSTSDGEQEELKYISCISYFPDGKQMISGSRDKTIRRWDLRKGKEIVKDREVYNRKVLKVGVSRDGRWVVHVIAGEKGIKVSEVETGIVRTFDEDSWIDCIDISADSTLLAGASWNQVRIWNLDTGASPFKIGGYLYEALGLSEDSRKLAVRSSDSKERHLQVWDVQTQKLDVQKSTHSYLRSSHVPIFWTTKHKTIVTAFNSPDDDHYSISEFDASTLNTVGAPFKHTSQICRLALSTDCVLLASASYSTIKLWAFESRQLLASFDVESPLTLLLSPDSRQLAYTSFYDAKIRICDIPANILASIESVCIPTYIHHLHANMFILPIFFAVDLMVPLQFPATSPLPRSHIVSGTGIVPYV
jgi:WD40 repeat protein